MLERDEFQRQPAGIGAQSEPGGVTERQHPGETEQKIHRHGAEPKHQHAAAEGGIAAEQRHPIGRQDQRGPDGGQNGRMPVLLRGHVSMPSSPSRPRGRTRSTIAIIT